MNNPNKETPRDRISRLVYVPAFASLIPIIGIPFGISAVLWGISDWRLGGKKSVAIACLGFISSLLFGWYAFFLADNMFFKNPNINEIKVNNIQLGLASIMRYIEYYKLGHGHYPKTLMELNENDITFPARSFLDPFSSSNLFYMTDTEAQNYFYIVHENSNSYELFSVGPDKTPHTQDDIYPVILEEYKSALGLSRKRIQSP
jgi:hypothetical protein